MKTYVELGLAALLAVLVYEKPTFLVSTANSTLGIIVMIAIVGILAKLYGINAGLLADVIMILLQDSYKEGNKNLCSEEQFKKGKCAAGSQVGMSDAMNWLSPVGGSCTTKDDCQTAIGTCTSTKQHDGTPKPCSTQRVCTNGKCAPVCQSGQCPDDEGNTIGAAGEKQLKIDDKHSQSSDEQFIGGMREGYTSTRIPLRPSSFPVTGTDQIGLSRMLKVNALHAKMAASQQANGCTNNGGGIAF